MKYLVALFTTLSIFAYSQTKKSTPAPQKLADAYNLKFKINGLKTGDTIFLANYYGDKQYLKDTAYVDSKGSFVFSGKETLPNGIYLVVMPGKQYFEVIVKEQNFAMETDTKDYTQNMKVTGSTENEAFYGYLKYVVVKGKRGEELKKQYEDALKNDTLKAKKLRDELIAVDKDVFEYRKNFVKQNPDKLVARIFKSMMDPEIPETPKLANGRPDSTFPYRYYKAHYWDNIDLNEDGLIRTPVFHGKLEKYIKQMVLQSPDSINKEADYLISKVKNEKSEIYKYFIWYVTNQYETSQIMGMDAVFVHMAEKYYLTGKAYWVNEDTEAKIRDRYNTLRYLLLNNYAPILVLQDTAAKEKSFTSIRAKFTVLFFWDPNCGHCQKETPKLARLYDSVKTKYSMEVYAINTQQDVPAWKNFIKTHKLNWINVYDGKGGSGFHKMYDIYSTPTMYILDENKKIVAKRLGVEQLADFMETYTKFKKEREKENK
ncbi:MAG: DUF5106 domain-containing protein [Bacteroidetes bacterium]|nr:MAG: DUF5106 domain-containing protein [Bacteroidota bacterium]